MRLRTVTSQPSEDLWQLIRTKIGGNANDYDGDTHDSVTCYRIGE
jgi:hypothetical protein